MAWRHGKLVDVGTWGHADFRGGTRFGLNTLCRLFCATKAMTATCVMTLVEEGLVQLEDPLGKYIPAFANPQVLTEEPDKTEKAKRPILIRHLLSHTSGIDYSVDLGDKPQGAQQVSLLRLQQAAANGKIHNLEKFVERLAKIPLSFHPGDKYTYSFSFDVLARVVEIIMGKPFDKCLEERVFGPLGMKDTMWAVPKSKLKRLAHLYGDPTRWKRLFGRKGVKRISNGNGDQALVQIDGSDE